jgi:hypothetical protein
MSDTARPKGRQRRRTKKPPSGSVACGTERARYQLMALSLETGVDHLTSERPLMVFLPDTPTLAGRLSPTGRGLVSA